MPLLTIQTNVRLSEEGRENLLGEASRGVAEMLGKPERYVMVSLEEGCAMSFAGDSSPLAYLELKSIGLPATRTTELSHALCGLVGGALGVPADRIYIEFADAERHMWGWNGSTF